jgi:outer membrane lipoprotein
MMKRFLFILLVSFLTACSALSPTIKNPPLEDLQLQDALSDVNNHVGKTVRWGGEVLSVNNREGYSYVHMVQFPLNSVGIPVRSKSSQGRFIGKKNEFLDPVIFSKGTLITFVGTFIETENSTVDQKRLVVPVLEITESHIWSGQYKDRGYYYLGDHHGRYVGYGYYGTGSYTP